MSNRFPVFRSRRPAPGKPEADTKIRLLRAMSAADLADFGAKPGDVARLVKELSRR